MNYFRNLILTAAILTIVACSTARAEDAAPPKEFTNSAGIEFRLIPAGEFMMGSPEDELGRLAKNETPRHKVRITKPFYIGVYEIKQGQWTKVAGTTFADLTSEKWKNRPPVGDDLPMYWMSWFDALVFCNKLSEKEGRKPYYKLTNIAMENYGNGAIDKADVEILGGNGYRLPSEAQWEYACRAGTTTALSSGKNLTSDKEACPNLDELGWYAANTKDLPKNKSLHKGGSKKPNAWGLYDMHGGLLEWCGDEFEADFYERSPVDDPYNTPSDKIRDTAATVRGGCFFSPPSDCRSAWRRQNHTCGRYTHMGFRVVAPVDIAEGEGDE